MVQDKDAECRVVGEEDSTEGLVVMEVLEAEEAAAVEKGAIDWTRICPVKTLDNIVDLVTQDLLLIERFDGDGPAAAGVNSPHKIISYASNHHHSDHPFHLL